MDLSSGGGGEGHIKMTSSFSSLFSFGETVGLTHWKGCELIGMGK